MALLALLLVLDEFCMHRHILVHSRERLQAISICFRMAWVQRPICHLCHRYHHMQLLCISNYGVIMPSAFANKWYRCNNLRKERPVGGYPSLSLLLRFLTRYYALSLHLAVCVFHMLAQFTVSFELGATLFAFQFRSIVHSSISLVFPNSSRRGETIEQPYGLENNM